MNFIVQNALPIVMVVLGLGFVIFIHELGHFLLAKWNGVKVEKFAIGFDFFGLRLYQKKIGETTYVIGALPFGGYVKMLGEDPGEAQSTDAADNPRAYHNKPVGARMAIISAGVIMNVLFGIACFTYVYMMGKREIPAVIGGVVPGMPAYSAGILAGDRVFSIDGTPSHSFDKVRQAAIFSAADQVLRVVIERPGQMEPVTIDVAPRLRDSGLAPTLGVSPPFDLALPDKGTTPFAPPAGFAGDSAAIRRELAARGDVVAIGASGAELEPVETSYDLATKLAAFVDRPVAFRVKAGSEDRKDAAGAETVVTLPPVTFVDFGVRMGLGAVSAVRAGGPADRAGVHPDDQVVSIDGDSAFDPMRLPDHVFAKARKGEKVTIVVSRSPGQSSAADEERIEIEPTTLFPWSQQPIPDAPLDIPGLGLALRIESKIVAVEPGSPAATAGLEPGQTIRALILTQPGDPEAEPGSSESKSEKARVVLDGTKASSKEVAGTWPGVFQTIQRLPLHAIEFEIDGREDKLSITPAPATDWYYPWRGLRFAILVRRMPPQSLPAALASGWNETVENISFVYYLIRGLFQRRMSTNAVGGPIPIAQMAFASAQDGFETFLPFLGMLSINLAVVNFFPIPPLDGGQLLFLICEKIRGRPVPEKYQTPVMIAGLVFILLLFLAVNIKDVMGLFS